MAFGRLRSSGKIEWCFNGELREKAHSILFSCLSSMSAVEEKLTFHCVYCIFDRSQDAYGLDKIDDVELSKFVT